MKYIVAGGVLLLILVAAVLLPRKSVHAELIINGSPSEVWAKIMETASYGEWNPIFVAVEGVFAEGARMRVEMRLSDGSTTPVEALVEELLGFLTRGMED